jgi:hypothetical protein
LNVKPPLPLSLSLSLSLSISSPTSDSRGGTKP